MAHARGQLQRQVEGQALLRALTPREREVMQLVVTGQHNRNIAPALGISVRTVEVHKARLMDKLGVDNVADLVRISMLGTG
jgi:FixJ family two-component response regulator